MEPGGAWPGGGYVEVAVIAVDDDVLASRFARPLWTGDEPGMGTWRALGVQLASGTVVELIAYDAGPVAGFIVRIDATAELRPALDEFIGGLPLRMEQILWLGPAVA